MSECSGGVIWFAWFRVSYLWPMALVSATNARSSLQPLAAGAMGVDSGELSRLRAELERSNQQVETLKDRLKTLENEFNTLSVTLEQNANQDKARALETQEMVWKQMTEDLEKTHGTQQNDLREGLENLMLEVEAIGKKLEKAQEENKHKETELRVVRSELENVQRDNAVKLKEMEQVARQYESETKKLRKDLDDFGGFQRESDHEKDDELKQVRKDMFDLREEMVAELLAEKQHWEGILQDERSKWDSDRSENSKKMLLLENEKRDLEIAAKTWGVEKSSLVSKNVALSKEVEELRKAVDAREAEIQRAENRVTRKVDELERERRHFETMNNVRLPAGPQVDSEEHAVTLQKMKKAERDATVYLNLVNQLTQMWVNAKWKKDSGNSISDEDRKKAEAIADSIAIMVKNHAKTQGVHNPDGMAPRVEEQIENIVNAKSRVFSKAGTSKGSSVIVDEIPVMQKLGPSTAEESQEKGQRITAPMLSRASVGPLADSAPSPDDDFAGGQARSRGRQKSFEKSGKIQSSTSDMLSEIRTLNEQMRSAPGTGPSEEKNADGVGGRGLTWARPQTRILLHDPRRNASLPHNGQLAGTTTVPVPSAASQMFRPRPSGGKTVSQSPLSRPGNLLDAFRGQGALILTPRTPPLLLGDMRVPAGVKTVAGLQSPGEQTQHESPTGPGPAQRLFSPAYYSKAQASRFLHYPESNFESVTSEGKQDEPKRKGSKPPKTHSHWSGAYYSSSASERNSTKQTASVQEGPSVSSVLRRHTATPLQGAPSVGFQVEAFGRVRHRLDSHKRSKDTSDYKAQYVQKKVIDLGSDSSKENSFRIGKGKDLAEPKPDPAFRASSVRSPQDHLASLKNSRAFSATPLGRTRSYILGGRASRSQLIPPGIDSISAVAQDAFEGVRSSMQQAKHEMTLKYQWYDQNRLINGLNGSSISQSPQMASRMVQAPGGSAMYTPNSEHRPSGYTLERTICSTAENALREKAQPEESTLFKNATGKTTAKFSSLPPQDTPDTITNSAMITPFKGVKIRTLSPATFVTANSDAKEDGDADRLLQKFQNMNQVRDFRISPRKLDAEPEREQSDRTKTNGTTNGTKHEAETEAQAITSKWPSKLLADGAWSDWSRGIKVGASVNQFSVQTREFQHSEDGAIASVPHIEHDLHPKRIGEKLQEFSTNPSTQKIQNSAEQAFSSREPIKRLRHSDLASSFTNLRKNLSAMPALGSSDAAELIERVSPTLESDARSPIITEGLQFKDRDSDCHSRSRNFQSCVLSKNTIPDVPHEEWDPSSFSAAGRQPGSTLTTDLDPERFIKLPSPAGLRSDIRLSLERIRKNSEASMGSATGPISPARNEQRRADGLSTFHQTAGETSLITSAAMEGFGREWKEIMQGNPKELDPRRQKVVTSRFFGVAR